MLTQELHKVRVIQAQIKTLMTKGQVLGFKKYHKCYNACSWICWVFDEMSNIAFWIKPGLNPENDEVQKGLESILKVKAVDFVEKLEENNIELLTFVKSYYKTVLS